MNYEVPLVAIEKPDWPDREHCVNSDGVIGLNLGNLSWYQLVFSINNRNSYNESDYIGGSIEIRSKSNELLWKVDIKDKRNMISDRIFTGRVDVNIKSIYNICVSKVLIPVKPIYPDSPIGEFTIIPVNKINQSYLLKYVDSIVLLRINGIRNGKTAVWPCTGFFISDSTVMTNHHCVRNAFQDNIGEAYLYYDKEPIPEENKIIIDYIADYDKNLDYAVLILKKSTSSQKHVSVKIKPEWPKVDEEVMIIHHYLGKSKVLSYDEDSKVYGIMVTGGAIGSDFLHGVDTDPNSSGSPVFNNEGFVVGLHHYGYKPNGIYRKNRAVSFSTIIKKLDCSIKRKINIYK